MAAIAGGMLRGESGAVGLSTVSDGWVYKLSGTANSRGAMPGSV